MAANYADLEKDRGTGRTAAMLRTVHDMLDNGNYDLIVVVMQHHSMFRYAAALFCHTICPQALFTISTNRLTFRNRFGNTVRIQFVVADDEYERTRGYRVPVARDHDVVLKRSYPVSNRERMHIDELQAAGKHPLASIFIPK